MYMMILIGLTVFITIMLIIEGSFLAFRSLRNPEKRRVQRRLRTLSSVVDYEKENLDILRNTSLSEVPWLNRVLLRLRWTDSLRLLLEQADIHRPLGFFVLLSLVFALAGFLIGSWMFNNYLVSIALIGILGILPFFYVFSKKSRRMKKFEKQLPDAMDLIARALKAGHAFSSGLKMVCDEFDDPVGTEFGKTLSEINFGVGVPEALKALPRRVDCPDLRFFVISVILQRETGGNLAEILENIAHLIRERFKLQGYIRVLAAEGKLSAIVLVAIPFAAVFILSIISPEYTSTLITEPAGKIMTFFGLVLMILGILTMRRMIKIEV